MRQRLRSVPKVVGQVEDDGAFGQGRQAVAAGQNGGGILRIGVSFKPYFVRQEAFGRVLPQLFVQAAHFCFAAAPNQQAFVLAAGPAGEFAGEGGGVGYVDVEGGSVHGAARNGNGGMDDALLIQYGYLMVFLLCKSLAGRFGKDGAGNVCRVGGRTAHISDGLSGINRPIFPQPYPTRCSKSAYRRIQTVPSVSIRNLGSGKSAAHCQIPAILFQAA